jgi:hypothetical protein
MSENKKPSGRKGCLIKGCLITFAIACIVAAGPALMFGMSSLKYSWQDGVGVANPVIVKVLPAIIFLAIGITILLVIGYRGYRNRKR